MWGSVHCVKSLTVPHPMKLMETVERNSCFLKRLNHLGEPDSTLVAISHNNMRVEKIGRKPIKSTFY